MIAGVVTATAGFGWMMGEAGTSPASEPGGVASLVFTTDNSAKRRKRSKQKSKIPDHCENFVLVAGTCVHHGAVRYRMAPCGRRGCKRCGPIGRWRIAERIAFGVRWFWPCAWLVLTFAEEEASRPEFKKKAVRRVAEFRRRVFRELGVKSLPYASTFELTKKGRLHVNLIFGNWRYIPQKRLQELWGARVWVERVKESVAIGREVAKAYSPESLGGYLSKLEQAVPQEWGRRCSFSRDWPKLKREGIPRQGEIVWKMADSGERIAFFSRWEAEVSPLVEILPGEFCSVDEGCRCFEFAPENTS